MKYRLIIGDGQRSVEGNNKAHLIKWANEYYVRCTVEEIATGNIIYENAAQRRINKNLSTLHELAEAARNGNLIIKE